MNRGDVKQEVRSSLGAISLEVDSELDQWIDSTIRQINGHSRWPWDYSTVMFTVRGDIVGTGTWTIGTFSVTLSTGNPATQSLCNEYIGGLIQLNGNNVYKISAWDQPTAVITVTTEILDATAASPTALQIIQDTATLPSTVESVIDVHDLLFPSGPLDKRPLPATRLGPNPFDHIGALPYWWWTVGIQDQSATSDIRLALFPPPDQDRQYEAEVWLRPTFPTADGDSIEATTRIPERWHYVLVEGVKMRAFEFEFENQATQSGPAIRFLLGLQKMEEKGRLDAGVGLRMKRDPAFCRRPWRYGPRSQRSYLPNDRITGV